MSEPDITIPDEALETAYEHYRAACQREKSAREAVKAALLAGLRAWPGRRVHRPSVPPRPPTPRAVLILPLPEKPDDK